MFWKRNYLMLEGITLFGGVPLLIYMVHERGLMILLMWLTALGAYHWLKYSPRYETRMEWNMEGFRAGWKHVFLRFLCTVPLLALFTWWHDREDMFSFMLDNPRRWGLVMLLYPVLSAWPQEILYRKFLYHRYRPFWTKPWRYILVSAIAFSYAHLIFMHWITISLTAVGGALFGQTYLRHRSMALICFEHALYGCFIFTIGLGWYFYGTAWAAAR